MPISVYSRMVAVGVRSTQPATISALAERLQLLHHSTVGLVDRLARWGLVVRRRDSRAGREVLRPAGAAVLRRLALFSIRELRTEGPALVAALKRLIE